MTDQARIAELRREYAEIHEQVLAAFRRPINDPNSRYLLDLQDREHRVIAELRRLGTGPYSPLQAARAC